MAITLRDAIVDDIAFIMACERRPGYAPFVGRWPEETHRANLADKDFRYRLACEGDVPRGFAILHRTALRPQNMFLKRTAMHDAERGHGRAVLTALCDWVFDETDTHRLWLEVVDHNARARHLYESLGFVAEGTVRESYANADGTWRYHVQMSLLKPDWIKRRG